MSQLPNTKPHLSRLPPLVSFWVEKHGNGAKIISTVVFSEILLLKKPKNQGILNPSWCHSALKTIFKRPGTSKITVKTDYT